MHAAYIRGKHGGMKLVSMGGRFRKCIIKNLKDMEALMCLFGIAIGAGLVTGLWLVAKFAARNIDGDYDE